MNKILQYIFVFSLIIGLNSCCTKKDCGGVGDLYQIDFYNFTEGELDSLIIFRFKQNTNFTEKIDSSINIATWRNNFYFLDLSEKFNFNFDYKIIDKKSGNIYKLNGFIMVKNECNICFPYKPQSNTFYTLESYFVNGNLQNNNQIKIFK